MSPQAVTSDIIKACRYWEESEKWLLPETGHQEKFTRWVEEWVEISVVEKWGRALQAEEKASGMLEKALAIWETANSSIW